MNVGIVIIQSHEGMREKFATAAAQGFKHCQLVSWDVTTWTEESIDVIKGLCEEFGIEITAFWCGWVGPKRWNFTEEKLWNGEFTAPLSDSWYRETTSYGTFRTFSSGRTEWHNATDMAVAGGTPIYATSEYGSFCTPGNDIDADFCLCASGDSMIGARIFDGDIVFIRAQDTVENGEVAAVIIGDEATLKRVYFYPDKNKLVLSPENPKYAPLVYMGGELESIKIIGKAVAFQSTVI